MANAAGLPSTFPLIKELAQTETSTITLGQLMRRTSDEPESMLEQARWLRRQMPIRTARRLDDMYQLPFVVACDPSWRQVMDIYERTFDAIHKFPELQDSNDEARFCQLIRDRMDSHKIIAQLLAEGYSDVREAGMYPHLGLDDFLDRLFINRISTRILCENYIQMRAPRPGFTGVVQRDLRPVDVAQNLCNALSALTRHLYGFSPTVELRGNLTASLDYIPNHVQFMLRELLKNAVRSTAERHRDAGQAGQAVPPVIVELQKGDYHLIIKVSDQGGGMSRQVQREAWKYGWSSVAGENAPNSKELAGFGFGLPLTRLFARYFGGDVFMQALPGHGTDMYLLLNHLKEGTHATETDDPSTSLETDRNSMDLGDSIRDPLLL